MRCTRCRGRMFPDLDGGHYCLMCGSVTYDRAPAAYKPDVADHRGGWKTNKVPIYSDAWIRRERSRKRAYYHLAKLRAMVG